MNSFFGITKGTALEQQVAEAYQNEINAVGLYHGLAMLAKSKGEDETADLLTKLAGDEARHAGTYAILNGLVAPDVFSMLKQVVGFETGSVDGINALAKAVGSLGNSDAAKAIEAMAQDEARHGVALADLVKNK